MNLCALILAIGANCQLLRDEERPARYVLPYSGLGGGEDPEVAKEDHYYKPNRRSERIPATAYQYDETDEEYYRPQPRPKVESDNYRYQPTTPSHKDYEEILKNNHLARLRVAAKKHTQPPTPQPQLQSHAQVQAQAQAQAQAQPVEQYLKEVNPTTKTAYQRPANYLRFNGQSSALKHDQNEETPTLKQQPYRYVLQPDLQQQKSYPQYQFESQQESIKPKTPHFNIVAYQNALNAQQKLLAAENSREEGPSKSPVYASQNASKKTKKQKTTPPSRQSTQQYDYYSQVAPQRPTYTPEAGSVRFQQPLTPRNLYPKSESNFQVEDSLLYPEHKEIEYQTQAPARASKPRTTRLPRRKPKYQTEEPPEDFQRPLPKYQQQDDETYDYSPSALKYQDEQLYRRPLPRPTKPSKYEEQTEARDDYLYQPLPKYQRENLPRRPPPQYPQDPEVRPPSRYLNRQQYQEESKQLPQYREAADLAYQPTADAPVRHAGRGPKTYPQYQYDRRQQFVTPVQPKTRHFNSVEYQNALIAEQEEEQPTDFTKTQIQPKTQKPPTQTSRLYKYYTRLASQRQSNIIKLAPVRYLQKSPRRNEKKSASYEVDEEPSEEIEQAEQLFNYQPSPAVKYQEEQLLEDIEPLPTYRLETKRKGSHYQGKPSSTYLNGQMFQEEVTPLPHYQPDDLATQPSSNVQIGYDGNQRFLILVYDE
ncbi:PAX-interacting protein 1 [Asbolus verrucosus]|uniref:PAX-interacting protein 1 n=1 Tax=Asbolus verrucosus TaxID=1661398 RepID=A0A482W3U9_ASBVE|nr:PAX-interacting protein 1 [Asbolus verrucosus]